MIIIELLNGKSVFADEQVSGDDQELKFRGVTKAGKEYTIRIPTKNVAAIKEGLERLE